MSTSEFSDTAAICAALHQDWKEAIRINTKLLKNDKSNINALNRLGYAYLKSGQLTSAKKTFQKVTKIDPYNQIAVKNLKKLSSVSSKSLKTMPQTSVSPMQFLEDPGKTKIVECIHAAPKHVLSAMSPGEEVHLKAKNHTIEIRNLTNTYIAALPDDLSFRLIKFLAAGNTYLAHVKSIGKNTVTVFVREITRGKKFLNQPSFTSSSFLND